MKVLELFAGTSSVGNAFRAAGHEVYTVDWDSQFNPDLCADIMHLQAGDILRNFGRPDIIWASPDCTTYSVAAISKHRRKNPATGSLDPISNYAQTCDFTNKHVLNLIRELNPRYWFIENPRGGLRKMWFMRNLPRYTVTYCQYEQDKPVEQRRMKPTDIWTNHPNPDFLPPCKNGAPCHAPAPRGSATGTQGLKNAKEKARIPRGLCEHIVKICEGE